MNEPQVFFGRLRDELLADQDTAPTTLVRLVQANFQRGVLNFKNGNQDNADQLYEAAAQLYQKALVIYQRLTQYNPSDLNLSSETGFILIDRRVVLSRRRQVPQAIASFERARSIFERLISEDA